MAFQYQLLTLGRWVKGITDYPVGAAPELLNKAYNFDISPDDKMRLRPGSSYESDTLTNACNQLAQGITQLIPPLVRFSGEQGYRHTTASGETLLFYRPNDTTTAFTELLGLASNSLYPVASSRSAVSVWNKQIYLTPNLDDWFPQRVWDDSGTLKLASAFLPAFGASISTAGAMNQYDDCMICLVSTHEVGDRSYEVRSAPLYQKSVTTAGTGDVGITIYAPTGHNWDISSLTVEIYRTIQGGTTYYLVASFLISTMTAGLTGGSGWNKYEAYGKSVSIVSTANDSTIVSGASLYTNDGTSPFGGTFFKVTAPSTGLGIGYNHYPILCKNIHITEDGVAYRGNVTEVKNLYELDGGGSPTIGYREHLYPNRVYQGVPGIPESQPDDFFFELEDDNTGITSFRGIPIFFTRNRAYRAEGVIDRYGGGTAYTKRIEYASGTSSHRSLVQTPKGIFYAGQYGFYWTNGYESFKISEGLNDTYAANIGQDNTTISGTYDPVKQQVVWAYDDLLYILHLNYGVSPYSTFTTWGGYDEACDNTAEFVTLTGTYVASIDTQFRATDVAYYGDKLHRAAHIPTSNIGFVFKFDETKGSDPLPASYTATQGYLWDLRTAQLDFGSRALQKWTPQLTLGVQGIAASGDTVTLNMLLKSDRNLKNDPLSLKRFMGTINDGALFKQNRKLPSPGLRCEYRQIQLQAGFPLPSQALITSTSTGITGTIEYPGDPVFRVNSSTGTWPAGITGSYMSFSYDDYQKIYLITGVSFSNVFIDPTVVSGDRPPAGVYDWIIRDYVKDCRFQIEDLSIVWAPMGDGRRDFRPSDVGE